MSIDCVVKNGKLVIPKFGILESDIAIAGEKIVQIGHEIPDQGKAIDAKGKYVFPGCVDLHTHYGHFNEFYNEMETESKSLASQGITTSVVLLDRSIKNMEGWKEKVNDPNLFEQPLEDVSGFVHAMWRSSYKKIFPEVIEKSEKHSTIDFAFRLGIVNTDQMAEIPYYHKELGVSTFKAWTGLYRSVALSPREMWVFFNICKDVGVQPYINTVNFDIQEQLGLEVEKRAKFDKSLSGPRLVNEARGAPLIETLDLQTTLWLAKEAGLPELLIAHVASEDAVKLIRHYRSEYGLNVQGEACGSWLDFYWPDVGELLGYMATCIVPQISSKKDVDALWKGIRTGDITCVGTDGVVSPREKFPDGKPNPLYMPPPTKDRQGMGFPCHICNFPVTLHNGMERGFSPVEIAEICAYNPAKLMRLFPKKGTIAVGSDADLVIVDIGKSHIVKKEELHTAAPFNPWEGKVLNCWPKLTMLRGQVICQDSKIYNEKSGKYLPTI